MKDISAFPHLFVKHPTEVTYVAKGMTMRDYFAAKAMTGLLTAEIVGEYTNEHIASISFLIADAMMKARSE
jgi:hypothetical protein